MSDFCKACSIAHFGKDFEDFAGLTDDESDKAAVVICEGCGPIQVDSTGRCISPDCLCKGRWGHGAYENDGPRKVSAIERQRFIEAVALLCQGQTPPDDLVDRWLKEADNELQEWAANRLTLPWSMGITVLEAAGRLSFEPAEGIDDET